MSYVLSTYAYRHNYGKFSTIKATVNFCKWVLIIKHLQFLYVKL